MKKTKLPGGNISLKTKKTEDPLVMAWLNAQSNLMDSFRYLIEKEIQSNGVRNLQAYIPAERTGLHDAPDPRGEGRYQALLADRQQLAAAIETVETIEENEDEESAEEEAGLTEPASSSEPDEAEEIDDEDIEAWS
ncbi:hypothetical protein GZH47_16745 [Paenibacillus rhizovicinus]|uniref:Uncharacterized protein n=1 Tax=Paenibacillus rhizovicinus TaxID=2704463 RepID=A0A6C0P1Q9_9BACL|nr:hypothetical protein [Paenibacillus rhizovicinus]QHW32291.1 hypothetical protein GZH47_16745 [Paenibacillus rhizovicinus]